MEDYDETERFTTLEHFKSFEFSEIDFDMDKYVHKVVGNVIEIEKGTPDTDNHPIEIDRILKRLNYLKKKGCNFVALDYHVDHIGYIISGLKVYASTEEEIEAEKAKAEIYNEGVKKIQGLQKQIEDIRKNLKR